MARKTDGEKVDDLQKKTAELEKVDAVLTERTDATYKSLTELYDTQREAEQRVARLEREFAERMASLQREADKQIAELRLGYEKQLAELRREHETETRLLKQQVDELKEELKRWGSRLWQFAIGIVMLVLGAVGTLMGLKK